MSNFKTFEAVVLIKVALIILLATIHLVIFIIKDYREEKRIKEHHKVLESTVKRYRRKE